MNMLRERYIYLFFRVSIFFKGALSLIEIASGITALLISPAAIGSFIVEMSQDYLVEDPNVSSHCMHCRLDNNFPLHHNSFSHFIF
jgi:uncharacterized membrane protein